jgi:hypothetical protein
MDHDGICRFANKNPGNPLLRTNHMSDLMITIRVPALQTSTTGTKARRIVFCFFFGVTNASMSGLRATLARVSERLPLDVRVLAAVAKAKVRYVNP